MIGLSHTDNCADLMSSNLACAKRARGQLRRFSRPSWTILTRSLAAWLHRAREA
jgi:hypothetical protein